MALAHPCASQAETLCVLHHDLIEAAIAIGDEIVAATVRDNAAELHWMSWTVADSWKSSGGRINWVQRASPYIYDGNAGVSLFLGSLYAVTGVSAYGDACRAGLKWALRQHHKLPKAWGFFSGGAGLAYACIHAGRAISDPTLEHAGWDLLMQIEFQPEAGIDVISGAAGTLLALAACADIAPDTSVLEAKLRQGAHALRTMADHAHVGWAWRVPLFPAPLTGYAHGTSGVVHSLLEVFSVLSDEAWIPYVAEEGFHYEDHYSRRAGEKLDWPDLRNNPAILQRIPGQALCMRVWCYGSVGMAFSRLRAYEVLKDSKYLDDAKAAWNAAAASVSSSLDLCHGAGGLTDLDLEFYRVLGEPKYLEHGLSVARHCIALRAQSGTWFNGTNVPQSDPSLMQGLAGMGFALLRTAVCGNIPSILFPRSPLAIQSRRASTPEPQQLISLETFRWAHTRAHFPLTLSLLESLPVSHLKPSLFETLCSSTSDLLAFAERLRNTAASNGPSEFVAFLLDCLDFETSLLQIKIDLPQSNDLFTAPFAPAWKEVDIDRALFARSPSVRMIRTRWNWNDMARRQNTEQIAAIPAESPTVFACFPYEEKAESLRVTALVGMLWNDLTTPTSGSVLVQRCLERVTAKDRSRLESSMLAQLEQMYKAQMVRLVAQSEVTAA